MPRKRLRSIITPSLIYIIVFDLLLLGAFFVLQNTSIGKLTSSSKALTAPQCKTSGCSGQLCINTEAEDIITTCEFLPEYTCYHSYGQCEVQAEGSCGWSQTAQLTQCLDITQNNISQKCESCGGFTLPEHQKTCADGLTCFDSTPLIADDPGICIPEDLTLTEACPDASALPLPTCQPRPTCLDTIPRCLLPEPQDGWCPTTSPTPIACQEDARLCPDGTVLQRDPSLSCEFPTCPDPNDQCHEYVIGGNSITLCATCGDGVCQRAETCTSSSCSSEGVCTDDCGPLYCRQDCEFNRPTPTPSATCGNGICEINEYIPCPEGYNCFWAGSCPQDCQSQTSHCGNKFCETGESEGEPNHCALDCPQATPGWHRPDLNRDCIVDILDYSLLVRDFLRSGTDIPTDINTDQVVDILDYSHLVRDFLKTCLFQTQ